MHSIANTLSPQNTFGRHSMIHQGGFSLVEISAALGIVSFAFVALLGLMANGVGQFREAMDTTITAQIASRMINDAQQSEFSELVNPNGTSGYTEEVGIRYFDEHGNEILPSQDGELSTEEQLRVVYRVGTRIRPQAELPRHTLSNTPNLAQVTVQVAHSPGATELELESKDGATQNLFKRRPGVAVFTYSTLVARN